MIPIFKKGNTAQNDNYTGINGEITIDTTKKSIRVHDGITQGGKETALSDLSNTQFSNILNEEITNRQNADSALDTRLDTIEGNGVGSIAKSLQDAKDYADAQVLAETELRSIADDTFNELLDNTMLDVSNLQTDLSNEIQTRTNADTTLQNQINLLASGADLLTLQNRVDALEEIDSSTRLDTLELGLSQEILDRQTAVSNETLARTNADGSLQTELNDTQSGAGLGVDGSYSIPEGNTYLGASTSLRSALLALDVALASESQTRSTTDTSLQGQINDEVQARIDADNAIDLRIGDIELHHLHTNSFYANQGVTDIQDEIDNIGILQGQVIFATSGSFGGANISITNKTDLAIVAPDVGDTITTLTGDRTLTIDGTSEKIRIANINFTGALNINATKGRHTFSDCVFQGGVSIDATTDTTDTFIVFQDCEFENQNINISNLTNCTVYFDSCDLKNNRILNTNNSSANNVIVTNCTNLNTLQVNITSGVVLKGTSSYNDDTVKNFATSSEFINLNTSVITTFTGSYNELNDLPTLVTQASDLSDYNTLLLTSMKGVANGVAELDANGLVPNHHLPPLALTKPYVVNTIADRDALTGIEMGDVAIVTNDPTPANNGNYIYDADGPSWIKLYNATAPVNQVNGQIGDVTLSTGDINEGQGALGEPSQLYFTDNRAITAVVTSNINTDDKAPSTQTVKTYVTGITDALDTRLDSVESSITTFATTTYVDNGLASKLNSSSYTASDVFNKVLTLDGSGSGLDADLLDGIHASSFVQTTGTQSIAGVKTFSDAPIVPDQSASDNSTKVANTKYVDSAIASIQATIGSSGTLVYQGTYNATANTPSLVSAKKGFFYQVSVGGTLAGINLTTNDQIVFVADVSGGVVQATDFTVIDNTESGLSNGNVAVANIGAGTTMQAGIYYIYDGSTNISVNVPARAVTQGTGAVTYLRIRGTGQVTLNASGVSGGEFIVYGDSGTVNGVKSVVLTKAGEYKLVCTRRTISGTVYAQWDVTVSNDRALRTTDDLAEGTTNKYASATNVRPLLSAGTGISYSSSTGVITNSAPYSDASARLALSAGTGISYNNTSGAISLNANLDALTDVVVSSPTSNQILAYNGTNWVNTTNTAVGSNFTPIGITAGANALAINNYYFGNVSGITATCTMPTGVANGDSLYIHNLGSSSITISSFAYYFNGAYSGVGQNFVISTNDLFRFTAYVTGGSTFWFIAIEPSQNLRTTTNLTEGTNLFYTTDRFDTRFATKTTDNLTQGSTNFYFSDDLAKSASVVNSMAGTQTDQAPSVSSVKSYYTGGTGITVSSGTIASTITQYTDELAQDASASLFTSGTHTGISFTYGATQDTANRIDATVSLASFSTTNLSEGTNLYYTQERAEDAVNTLLTAGTHTGISYSYTDNGTGAGSLSSTVSLASFSIDALSDVDTTTSAPTNGQALGWDSATSKWKPTTITGSGGTFLVGTQTSSSTTISLLTAFDNGESEYVLIYTGTSTTTVSFPDASTGKKIIVKNFSNSIVNCTWDGSSTRFIYDGLTKVATVSMPAGYPGFSTTFVKVGNDWVVV